MMRKRLLLGVVLFILLFGLAAPINAVAKGENPGKGPPAIEVVVFVHYPKGHVIDKDQPTKPDKPPGKPDKPGGKDEKEPYKIIGHWDDTSLSALANLSGSSMTDATSFLQGLTDAFEAWDDASGLTVSLSQDDKAPNSSYLWGSRDTLNVVSWESLASDYPNAIAVCWVWRYVNTKEIIEADIALGTEYPWLQNAVSGNPDLGQGEAGYMDVQNITTHEFGHFVGLGDIRQDSQQTMYAYGDYAEVKKRSLESGDIAGVQKLYGP